MIRVILKEDKNLSPIEYFKNQYGDVLYFNEYGEADEALRKSGYTEEQIDQFTFDDCTVTAEEAEQYMNSVGYPHDDGDWLLDVKRQSQVREAIDNRYNLCDFDRWQHIQNILFHNETNMLDYEYSQKLLIYHGKKTLKLWNCGHFKTNSKIDDLYEVEYAFRNKE